MDLPIIFADDNQMITDSGSNQPELVTAALPQPPQPHPKPLSTTGSGKFLFLNKQVPFQNSGNIILSQPNVKKIPTSVPIKNPANTIKYTKIILSKRPTTEEAKSSNANIIARISHLSPEISVKKVETTSSAMEPVDLENELVATAVPKPNCPKSDVHNVTVVTKKPDGTRPDLPAPLQTILNEALAKRSAELAELNVDDESDPDYIPPKNIKLDKM